MKNLFIITFLIVSVLAKAQDPIVSVPFELYGDHLFIQLSVDGSEPKDFIFDTGDGLSVIDIDVATALGLDLTHKKQTSGASGTITSAEIKHNKVEMGGITMETNIKFYATSLAHLEISIGRNVDGIIGYDLIQNHAVGINYTNMTFNVYDSSLFPKAGTPVAIKLISGIPTIEAEAVLNDGQKLSGTFFVNTGAGTTMDFNTPFANANNIVDRTGDHYSYVIKGLGDVESTHYEGRVSSFSFAGMTIENMPVGISQSASGLQGDKHTAGIIGNRLMMQFNMMIDINGGKLYLEPNASFGKAIPVNCSGIDVQMSKDQSNVMIHKVFAGSQAESAGLQVDDVLVSIDGQSAKDLGLMKVEKILKTPGSTVTIKIDRGGEMKEFKLALKELI